MEQIYLSGIIELEKIKMNIKKQLAKITIGVCGIGIVFQGAASAEGVNGPNKSLITPPGYGSVSISVTRNGGMKSITASDKPTIYLGFAAPFALDAGAVYEPVKVGSTGFRSKRMGWSIFIQEQWKPGQTSPPGTYRGFVNWVGDANHNEILDANFGTRSLTFTSDVNDGLSVSMSGIGTITAKEPRENRNFAGMQVKRVVGITQQSELKKNGSYMLGTTVKSNELGMWVKTGNTWSLVGVEHWPTNLEYSQSKYYPGGSPQGRINGEGTKFMIELRSPWKRNADGSDKPISTSSPSRLESETVDIDLRKPSKLQGILNRILGR